MVCPSTEAGIAPGPGGLCCLGDWLEVVGPCEPYQLAVGNHDALPQAASSQLFCGNQVIQRSNTDAELPGRFFAGVEEPRPLHYCLDQCNSFVVQNCRQWARKLNQKRQKVRLDSALSCWASVCLSSVCLSSVCLLTVSPFWPLVDGIDRATHFVCDNSIS